MASRNFLTDITLIDQSSLFFQDDSANEYSVSLTAPSALSSSYDLVFPAAAPSDGDFLEWDNFSGAFIWSTPSSGGITSLNGETGTTQTFSKSDDDNVTLTISSSSNDHEFSLGWTGTLADSRLSSNVGLLNAPNLWTASQEFSNFNITGSGGRSRITSSATATRLVTLTDSDGEIPLMSDLTPADGEFMVRSSGTYISRGIIESDITDLGSYLEDITNEPLSDLSDVTITSIGGGEILLWNGSAWINQTFAEAQISQDGHTHVASDIVSGTFADALVAESNVTQHEAALTITESQISDLGSYIENITNENIADLSDVVISSVADNEVLAYDNGSGNWINQTPSEAGLAAASHTHAAGDITSGVLSLLRGGTGTDTYSSPTNFTATSSSVGGMINGIDIALGLRPTDLSSFDTDDLSEGSANLYYTNERVDDRVAALLTAGTNITLTYDDGAGTLTIDAAGGGGGATDIADLDDVTITSVADGELLVYDSGSSDWINQTLAEAGIAAASHTHATSDITSGTFADARISESSVTQHEAALTVTESQISDLGSYYSSGDTILAANGSSGAPGFSFASDTNTGMFNGGTDALNLVCGGTVAGQFQDFFGSIVVSFTGFSMTFNATGSWSAVAPYSQFQNSNSANAAQIRLKEATTNGNHYVSLLSPTALASNYDITLPDTAPSDTEFARWNSSNSTLEWVEAVLGKSATVESPSASENVSLFFTSVAITISQITAVLIGSSTPSVTWTIRHGSSRSATGTEVVTSGTTTTSTTTGSVVTSFNDGTIPADSFVWLETTAQSGTVDELHVTIEYTVDA